MKLTEISVTGGGGGGLVEVEHVEPVESGQRWGESTGYISSEWDAGVNY